VYTLERELTQSDVIIVIDALHELFGQGWRFELESITEGGIQVVEWPDRESTDAFKTLRLGSSQWPWITCVDGWRGGTEIVFTGQVMRTYLKAFYEAPCWTVGELEKWHCAWARVGAKVVRKSLYPKHKYVSREGCLGNKPVRKRFRDVAV